uniref:Uncharacterized protein n=1 Tax=uncultured marine bacterium MedDCM-OCT-S04-C72 TaxID=743060 RepID=D6PGK5_9BACT|nr:hypothetical protein [uncultured marine bacterium MedDCM-OCT-S04-C72]
MKTILQIETKECRKAEHWTWNSLRRAIAHQKLIQSDPTLGDKGVFQQRHHHMPTAKHQGSRSQKGTELLHDKRPIRIRKPRQR